MRHPATFSHGLVVATAVLFWIVAGAARLQAAEAEPAVRAADTAVEAGRAVIAAADFDLAEFTQSDAAGRLVLLDFWASWCKPCKQSMPWLSLLQRKYGEHGLRIVAVSVDTDESAMRARLGEIDPGIAVVFDPKGLLAAKYQLEAMPTTILFDRAGGVLATHVGFLEAQTGAREAEIRTLLEKE